MDQENQKGLDQPTPNSTESDRDKMRFAAAQASLIEAEKRFEVLLGLSVDSYWEQDADFRYTKILGNGGNFAGLQPDDFLGKTRWELPTSEDDNTDWNEHKAILANHEPFKDAEFRRIDELGAVVWVSVSGIPIFDADNNFCGYRGTSTDITAKKRLQAQLRTSEERLRLAIDVAEIGVWEWDRDTDQLFWDKRQFELFGRTQIKGPMPLSKSNEWIHPDDWKHIAETSRLIIEGKTTAKADFRVIHPDGSTHWLQVNSGFIHTDDSESSGLLIGVNIDITERKAMEEKLRASEERLHMAFDVAKIGFFELDVTTDQLTLENREFKLLNLPAENATISWASYRENIHPDDVESVNETARYIIENRGPTAVEYRVINPDDSIRWIQASCGPKDPSDETAIAQIVGINVDTTRRKEAEIALDRSRQDLADLNRTLEDRVVKRTAELKSEAEQHVQTQTMLAASQRLDSIGQLAGGIAHDSNNLLSIILGNLELAAMKVTDPETREMIEDAQAAATAGVDLNHRLLGFARKQKLAPARLQVGPQVLGTVRLLERTIRQDVRIVTKIERNIWDIVADPSELTNALVNLAVNARDAMSGGGFLHIEARNYNSDSNGYKKDRSTARTDYVEIAVADTGAGMPADVLEKAFDPFFTTKDQGKGTGLGLSSVYGFAEQSGGFVEIDSQVGEGTTVRIYLPRTLEADKPKATTQRSAAISASEGELILVVEDEPNVRATTVKRLEHFGYQVIEASTGLEAIKLLQDGSPIKLVFSDIVMPGGMTGYHLAEWMRNHVPSIKVLLTSGYDDPDQESGKHDFQVLRKPHSLDDLAREFRNALNN